MQLRINVFAALVGPFDYLYKTNYFHLRSKPANRSPLDFRGPWPIYIAGTETVALVLFLLLYLFVRQKRKVRSAATEILQKSRRLSHSLTQSAKI
jgi:uncharacterized membrane protein YwaF